MRLHRCGIKVALAAWLPLACAAVAVATDRWSAREQDTLRELWIGSLAPTPADPSNRFADDPAAVALGHQFFFETRFSANGEVSCASCHDPSREFQDGTALARGVGITARRTMPIAGTSHAPFLFWDGRADSQWAQVLGPLEHPDEHGTTREEVARVVARSYRAEYERVFGALPALGDADGAAATAVFVNVGKAIAAYERQIQFGPSRFDRYVERLLATGHAPRDVLSDDEVAGLRLFLGKANCTQCHNGPLLSNQEFHNTGVPRVSGLPPDRGRAAGAAAVLQSEFSCLSRWSDARPEACVELAHLKSEGHELERAYKVPSLRNVAERAPFMHAGQFGELSDVVDHYDRAPTAPSGHSEIGPLGLSVRERRQLEAYLRSLSGGLAAPDSLLRPPVRPRPTN